MSEKKFQFRKDRHVRVDLDPATTVGLYIDSTSLEYLREELDDFVKKIKNLAERALPEGSTWVDGPYVSTVGDIWACEEVAYTVRGVRTLTASERKAYRVKREKEKLDEHRKSLRETISSMERTIRAELSDSTKASLEHALNQAVLELAELEERL